MTNSLTMNMNYRIASNSEMGVFSQPSSLKPAGPERKFDGESKETLTMTIPLCLAG